MKTRRFMNTMASLLIAGASACSEPRPLTTHERWCFRVADKMQATLEQLEQEREPVDHADLYFRLMSPPSDLTYLMGRTCTNLEPGGENTLFKTFLDVDDWFQRKSPSLPELVAGYQELAVQARVNALWAHHHWDRPAVCVTLSAIIGAVQPLEELKGPVPAGQAYSSLSAPPNDDLVDVFAVCLRANRAQKEARVKAFSEAVARARSHFTPNKTLSVSELRKAAEAMEALKTVHQE